MSPSEDGHAQKPLLPCALPTQETYLLVGISACRHVSCRRAACCIEAPVIPEWRRHAHPRRLRDELRIPANDANDRHAERALLALFRSGASGSTGHEPVGFHG